MTDGKIAATFTKFGKELDKMANEAHRLAAEFLKTGQVPVKARAPKKVSKPAMYVDTVLEYITANPGLRSAQIAEGLGVVSVKEVLEELRAAGRVKTAGVKRGTTYQAKASAKKLPAQSKKHAMAAKKSKRK